MGEGLKTLPMTAVSGADASEQRLFGLGTQQRRFAQAEAVPDHDQGSL